MEDGSDGMGEAEIRIEGVKGQLDNMWAVNVGHGGEDGSVFEHETAGEDIIRCHE